MNREVFHRRLAQWLNENSDRKFPARKSFVSVLTVDEIPTQEVVDAVFVFAATLNLSGGSMGPQFDLYELLKKYFASQENRDKINEAVRLCVSKSN